MKNPFSRKKDKFPKQTAPRTLEEIGKEYAELRAQAGDLQYRVHIDSEDLKAVNKRLKEVNNEAAVRINLDKAAAAEKAATDLSAAANQAANTAQPAGVVQ